jgi:hypothetical protein
MTPQELEDKLNSLISKCAEGGGHVFIVDKKGNNFYQRLTEPIRLHAYEGWKEDKNDIQRDVRTDSGC